MPQLELLRAPLAAYSPRLLEGPPERRAAVAMVLREADSGPEVLFIERARKAGDPWSGHMAFPGGRMDPVDPGPREVAQRETFEEVGLSLDDAELLGRLDDAQGRNPRRSKGMIISAFVYHAPDPGPLVTQASEVEDAFWFPLDELALPERHVRRAFRGTGPLRFPGVVVGHPERQVVWGLTFRFLEVFHQVVGRPFPEGEPLPAVARAARRRS